MQNKFESCILFTCLSIALLPAFAQRKGQIAIKVSNSSSVSYKQSVISIAWKDVVAVWPQIDTSFFKVITGSAQQEIPFQLEYRGESAIQNLLLLADVPANSTATFYLQKRKPASVVAKTFCRYVPERKDDFAWENDKIAFRVYGKALEGTKENANGIDVWVKRTDRLVLNERYQRGDYHIDHGDGMDYYHVGLSLGAGNIAPYVNDTIWFPANYRKWKVLDNGPLRSTFQLDYDEWTVAGTKVKMTKTISLDAGMQLSRIEVQYQYSGLDTLPAVVGIIKRNEPGTILLNEKEGVMAYWEPQHGADGTTGTGCVFPGSVSRMTTDNLHLLSMIKQARGSSFVYYAGAAWSKAGGITNADSWINYLRSFKTRLLEPLKISVQ